MRKSMFMGFGLALALAGTAAAQQQGPDRPKGPESGERAKRGVRGERDGAGFLLRGITLTEAQRTQLQALRQSERAGNEARREQMKKVFDEARAARERGDTAAARAIMQRNRQQMTQAREQHIAAIRNVLTAEQRVQFDRNVAELKQRAQERGARGERGQRGQRGPGKRGVPGSQAS